MWTYALRASLSNSTIRGETHAVFFFHWSWGTDPSPLLAKSAQLRPSTPHRVRAMFSNTIPPSGVRELRPYSPTGMLGAHLPFHRCWQLSVLKLSNMSDTLKEGSALLPWCFLGKAWKRVHLTALVVGGARTPVPAEEESEVALRKGNIRGLDGVGD